jgi:cysteine desulfurase
MATYLDCNATTPLEPPVGEAVLRHMCEEFGNAGSRTHEFGTRAKQAVRKAREQTAAVVAAKPDEVVFTSGATESNNLAILGLAAHGVDSGRKHIVSTQIEHKAVLEPVERLSGEGFDVDLVAPGHGGWVDPTRVLDLLRPDTLLVSVMLVNNETGVCQPIGEIAEGLTDHPAFLHTDAAQGFGKNLATLKNQRIDLISVSGHKAYAPKGVGALIARRRGYNRIPLRPLMVGGGQERGLRPGTLPVHLIAGLGVAAEIASRDADERATTCRRFRDTLWEHLAPLEPVINGDEDRCLPHTLNISIPGVDAEAAIVVLKDLVAISNGSACTSHEHKPSHVLEAMGCSPERIRQALRFSWCHMTPEPDWEAMVAALRTLQGTRRT